MDDDDDLEMLRLAALKSLKKENVPVGIKTALQVKAVAAAVPKSVNKIQDNRVIPVVSNIRHVIDKYYVAPGGPELVQPNLIHHPVSVPAYIDAGFEKIDINDAYIPQRLKAPLPAAIQQQQQQQPLPPLTIPTAVTYTEFNPYAAVNEPISTVQLSPRSAAFVYQNKQIVKRRQGIAPSSPPSPSSNPFRQSPPGRWSRSPSPEPNSRYHRNSRSPTYLNHSPHYRNRSMSRSPQRRHHSPQMAPHMRRHRSRSRSPMLRANFEANVHRAERRSPVPNRRANNSPPNNRHGPRSWRPHSPSQRDNNSGGMHARKSGSPRADEANSRRRHRTRSPNSNAHGNFKGQQDNRKRTDSRSPNRKNARMNRGRKPTPPQSQQKRFNNSNSGSKPGYGGVRNRAPIYNRRSGSPAQNHRRTSNSPQNHYKRRSPAKNPTENGDTSNKHAKDEKESTATTTVDRNERSNAEFDRRPIDGDASNEPNIKEKTDQEIEDELLASSESENSDNDGSDGIDLFASEESESENEGRFKLNSSKTERKTTVPTLSFSELGKAKTAPADVLLRDLDEMQTDAMNSQPRRSGARRENDRNIRNHHDKRKFNRDRDRTNRDRERNRDSRDGDGDRNRPSRRERESSKPKVESVNDKGDRKSTILKSTFTSIGESRTKTSNAGKFKMNRP